MATYTDSLQTLKALLAAIPGPVLESDAYSLGPDRLVPVDYQALRDLVCSALKGESKVDCGLVSSDGTSGSTIAIYRLDLSAGIVEAAGLFAAFAAQPDVILLGAGNWAKSYKLNGAAGAVLSADGKTYNAAIVAVRVTAGVVLCAVFGAEANDGAEAAVTSAQIRTALDAALAATPAGPLAGLDTSSFVVCSRVKIQRVAVNTIVYTHTNTITNSTLLNERLGGTLGSLT
jgi:hypothetical protein